MKFSITRPFGTATPDSAMKPTAADTENGGRFTDRMNMLEPGLSPFRYRLEMS
jgi:hypothetical protein